MAKEKVSAGKANGHGFGLSQVWEAIDLNDGKMMIDSVVGQGSQVRLTFPRAAAPTWCVEEIILSPQDRILILDDDHSIHRAWDSRFEQVIAECPTLMVHHFEQGQEVLAYIQQLTEAQKQHVLLLTDYELLRQPCNGLDVVAQAKIPRAILVTSHYKNQRIIAEAVSLSCKVLPKQLAAEVMIRLEKPIDSSQQDKKVYKKADAIIVDDDVTFTTCLSNYFFDEQDKVDYYQSPHALYDHLACYPKDTRIYLDNHFQITSVKGTEVAERLHTLGYTKLYLLSGHYFSPGELPEYLTAILKTDFEKIKDW